MRTCAKALFAALFLALALAAGPRPAAAQVVSEAEIQGGLYAMQILLAGPLTEVEAGLIRAEIAGRSRTEPQAIKQEMAEMAAVVQVLAGLPDGAQMSAFRQRLLAGIFQHALHDPQYGYRAAVRILSDRLVPLVWNSGDGTFFSVADAQVVVWLNGGDPYDRMQVGEVALQVQQGYEALSFEDRLVLGTMHFAYSLGAFAEQLPQVSQTDVPSDSATGDGAPIEPWMLEIMTEVMNETHITTLNIIENMSDDGGYWEWEPAPDW